MVEVSAESDDYADLICVTEWPMTVSAKECGSWGQTPPDLHLCRVRVIPTKADEDLPSYVESPEGSQSVPASRYRQ